MTSRIQIRKQRDHRAVWVLFIIAVIITAIGAVDIAFGQQLMAPRKLAAVRASLPDLIDEYRHDQLHDEDVIWYTNTEMPAAYQHATGNGYSVTSWHSPFYNISGDPSDRFLGHGNGGNANVEFPWNIAPGGAHLAESVNSVKGFLLPGKPVIVFRRNLPGRRGSGAQNAVFDWIFPEGTVFIECLTMAIRDQDHVFEVRFRERAETSWEFDLHRPYATADSLADAIDAMGPGELRSEAVADLQAERSLLVFQLTDSGHNIERAFDESSEVYNLPMLKTDDVLELLQVPFTSVLGLSFKGGASAPSNNTPYANLVPPNYHGVFVTRSCMNCHDSANRHATEFEHPRGWYGRVRGNRGGILSWHPIDPVSISYNGARRTVGLRPEFVRAGFVRWVTEIPEGYQFIEDTQ